MTETQEILVKMIGKQLFGTEGVLPEPDDWNALLTEAQQQAVFPLAYAIAEGALPAEQRLQYMSRKYANAARNTRNLYDHTQLHRLLTENGFRYVILKGQASAMYYPDPMLRTMGDVDFLVDMADVDSVDALLVAHGYTKLDGAEKHGFHWAYKKGDETLELHWGVPGLPDNENAARQFLSDILDKTSLVERENGAFLVPSRLHHGLVLLLHTISHLTGRGVGLRHLCDWLVFENSMTEAEFCDTLEKPLKKAGLWTFAQTLTRVGTLYFGCPDRRWCEGADARVCKAFLEDVFAGGNFGVKDGTRKSQAKMIQDDATKKISRGNVLHNLLVSIDKRSKREFPTAAKTRVLLPFAWAAVVVQYAVRVASGKRNNVFDQKIYSDAMNRLALYSELKLFEAEQTDSTQG